LLQSIRVVVEARSTSRYLRQPRLQRYTLCCTKRPQAGARNGMYTLLES